MPATRATDELFLEAANLCSGLSKRELFWLFIATVALSRIPKHIHCFMSDVHNVMHEMNEEADKVVTHASN